MPVFVAHQHVGLVGVTGKIAKAGEGPLHPDLSYRRRLGDCVGADVENLKTPVLLFCISMSVSLGCVEKSPKPATDHARPDLAHRRAVVDRVVSDVVKLKIATIAVPHQHVGLAGAREIAEARNLPFQTDLAQLAALVTALLPMS